MSRSGSSAAPPAGSTQTGGKQAPTLRLRREEWALDRNYPQCYLCKSPFTLMNRRHLGRVRLRLRFRLRLRVSTLMSRRYPCRP